MAQCGKEITVYISRSMPVMPPSKRRAKVSESKFKCGQQVLYEGIEYFVVEAGAKNAQHLKLKKRFRPYSRPIKMAKLSNVRPNTDRRRKGLQKGDFVHFDFKSMSDVLCIIMERIGDQITIQPLNARYTFMYSVYSNSIGLVNLPLEDSIKNYVPREIETGSCNLYIQSRGRASGEFQHMTVIDYDSLTDRYLVQYYNRNIEWLKLSDMVIDYGDKDPYYCSWDTNGFLSFNFNDLFSVLGCSYSLEMIRNGDVDMESLRTDIWYRIRNTGINHFASRYDTDLYVFIILMWMEHYPTYWKKHHLNNMYADDMNEVEDKLIESLMKEDNIDIELIGAITRRKMLSSYTRRRAAEIESHIRSKPLFKTRMSYDDGFKVSVLQPSNARMRCYGFSKHFIYNYVTRILWYLSNRPVAPKWSETQSIPYTLANTHDRVQLKVPLKPFQERIIHDMRRREMFTENSLLHLNTKEGVDFNVISGFDFNMPFRGGILALDTGMGKTVCTLALIKQGIELYNIKPTLIVVPLTLIDQWIKELKRFTDLSYAEIHGRKNNMEEAMKRDVVFTTYGTLASRVVSSLAVCQRVVFDESHQLKSYTSSRVEACYSINARYRWCLTATPFRKGSFSNIQSQLKMLCIRPFQHNENFIKNVMESEDPRSQWIIQQLSSIIIKPDLTRYVDVPEPSIVRLSVDYKDTTDMYLYNAMFNIVQEGIINILERHGYSDLQRIKSLLNQLSVCAINPRVLPIDKWGTLIETGGILHTNIETLQTQLKDNSYEKQVKEALESIEDTTCCLCLETITRPTITDCLHIFCHDCIKKSLEFKNACPMCRNRIDAKKLKEIKSCDEEPQDEIDGFIVCNDVYGRRVKVPKSIYECYQKPDTDNRKWSTLLDIINKRDKVVIYSQYNSILECYANKLREHGKDYSIITGRSSRTQRNNNIEKFKRGDSKIFLLSTRVADVGINLTEGDTLVFMEPGLDSEVEKQAIGRLKRIGQDKKINVYKMITENTIETLIESERPKYDSTVNNIMTSNGSKSWKTKKKKQFFMKYLTDILNIH